MRTFLKSKSLFLSTHFVKMASTMRKCGLNALNEHDKDMAFLKANITTMIPGCTVVRITPSYYQEAMSIIKNSFMIDEPLFGSSGIVCDEEVTEWWMTSFRQNVSLMVFDNETDKPMGVLCIEAPSKPFNIQINNIALKHILAFCDICETNANFNKHFPEFEIVHFLAVSVLKEFRGRGIAKKLFEAATAMAKEYASTKTVLKVECTSNYTTRICEGSGYESLYEKCYDTYKVDGEMFFKNTGEHKYLKVMAKEL